VLENLNIPGKGGAEFSVLKVLPENTTLNHRHCATIIYIEALRNGSIQVPNVMYDPNA
jgi:hypothetical protein